MCAAALALRPDGDSPEAWLRPFSALAAIAVAALALTGAALSLHYIAGPAAAIGTSYGAMVLTKVTLFAALLVLGTLNHRALHGRLALPGWRAALRGTGSLGAGGPGAIVLRQRLEVEAGLAIVTIFLAAP